MLSDIANVLGHRHPGDLLGDLARKNGPANIMKRLESALNLPQSGAGTALSASRTRIAADLLNGKINPEVLESLSGTFRDFKIPFDLTSYKAILYMELADHTATLAIAQFGVEAEGIFTKAADMAKSVEALGFLRLSPTYPIRNFLNNELTMLGRGTHGIMSRGQIERLWERAGFTPERLGEGYGQAGDAALVAAAQLGDTGSAYQRALNVIGAVVEGDPNWMDKVGDFVKGINLGPFDAARYSQKLEQWASARAWSSAYAKVWNSPQGWRPGGMYDDFRKFVTDRYPNYSGARFDDEFVRGLHGVVSDAMGKEEIITAFRNRKGYSWTKILDDTARRMGISPEQIEEVLGPEFLQAVGNDVIKAMEVGDVDGVMRAMEAAHPEILKHMEDFAARSAIQDASEAGARIEAGDIMEYLGLYQRNLAAMDDAMYGHLSQLNDRIATLRALPEEMQGAAWDRLMKDNDVFFKAHLGRYEARLQGMIDAANKGGVAVPQEAIEPFRRMMKANEDFFRVRRSVLQSFQNNNLNFQRVRDIMDTEYQKLMSITLEEGRRLDDVLYRVVDHARPSLSKPVKAARETVHELRQRYMREVRDFFRKIDGEDEAAKLAAYQKFHVSRVEWQNRISTAERELLNVLYQGGGYGTGRALDPMTQSIYNNRMGGSYAQTFDDDVAFALKQGASGEQARMYAAAKSASDNALLGQRMEKFASDPITGRAANWYDSSMHGANLRLIEAERAGKDVANLVPGAAEQIQDVAVRINWLDRLAQEAGYGTPISKAALQELSHQWRSSTDFTNPELSPLRHGRYSIISPDKGGMSQAQLITRREALVRDLRNMGYDPIVVGGRYGGVDEVAVLTPGLREQDAFELGVKYDQESIVIGGQGLVNTTDIKDGNGVFMELMDFENVRFADDLEDFFTEITVGGKKVRFSIPLVEGADAVRWSAPLEGQGGMVRLYRMQRVDTPVVDPANSLARNGTKAANRIGQVDRLYYYIDGTPPESLKGIADMPHRLEVDVPISKIYDLADDPDGLLKIAGSVDEVEKLIKKAGYYGYRWTKGPGPNSVAVWEPLRHNAAPPVGQDELKQLANTAGLATETDGLGLGAGILDAKDTAPRASLATGSVRPFNNLSQSAVELRQQALDLDLPGLHAQNVDDFIAITEARARTWAIQTGMSPDDWYNRNLGSIRRGTPDIAAEHDAIFTQRMLSTDEFLDVLNELGLVPRQAFFNVLRSERLPDHLKDVASYMIKKRAQVLDPNGPGFTSEDVARAYLLTTSSIQSKAVKLQTIVDGAPENFARMTEGFQLDDYSFVNRAGDRMVRPEDFMAMYLRTEGGRRFLAAASKGVLDPDSMTDIAFIREYFGASNTLLGWFNSKKGIRSIPAITEELNGLRLLDEAAGEMVVDFESMGNVLRKLNGVGKAKDPFMRHFFGFGEMGVMDSRAIKAWLRGDGSFFTGQTPARSQIVDLLQGKAPDETKHFLNMIFGESEKGTSSYLRREPVADWLQTNIDESIRLMKRDGLMQDMPDEIYNYIIHAWIWDKVGIASGTGANTATVAYAHLAQMLPDTNRVIRGAIDLRDSKAIIHAFGAADESTLVHEIAHLFRRELAEDVTLTKQLRTLEDFYKIKPGAQWTRKQEEAFAKAFEVYLSEGIAPVAELEGVFERFANWLANIYRGIRGKELDVPINGDVRKIFDEMLDFRNATPSAGGGYINAPGLSPRQMNEMLPQTMPVAEASGNQWWTEGANMYEELVRSTRSHMDDAPLNWDDLTDDQMRLVTGYQDYLERKMPGAQLTANKIAGMQRDAALLNYSRRTNFDHLAGHIFPFGFWNWNSIWNWTFNQGTGPALLADYMRITRMMNHQYNSRQFPERFRNTVRINTAKLPFIPDWFGDIYVNPLRSALPFENWQNPMRFQAQEEMNLASRTEAALRDMMRAGEISPAEHSKALLHRSGAHWSTAEATARETYDPEHPIDNLSFLLSPHPPFQWAWHLFRGQKEKIGPFLPVTRSVRGITSYLGMNGGLGINPEAPIRRGLGLPEGDSFDQYRVERMLHNMLGDGMITLAEFHAALADKEQSEHYVIAQQRAAREYGFGAITSTLGIPAQPFPTGEERMRALRQDLDLAYESNDPDRIKEFFDTYPEINGRFALWDDPETRAPVFLTQQLWDTWHSLNTLEKRNVVDALGEDFQERFLDEDSRLDAEDQSMEDLVVWSKTLGLTVPSTIEGDARPFNQIPPEISKAAEAYYEVKRRNFPHIWTVQEEYYAIEDKERRRAFRANNPALVDYWKWRRDFLHRNPELIPYIVEDPSGPGSHQPDNRAEERFMEERAAEAGPTLTWVEWRPVISTALWRLVEDELRSGMSMGPSALEQLSKTAADLGMSPEDLIDELENSYGDYIEEVSK